jgi:CheY-like chemotaxis protein
MSNAAPFPKPHRPGRVLVAEDDGEMRRIIVETLRRAGHDVHDVGDGAALLIELARNSRFHYDSVDVVVADVRMPLCSGLQALETIRRARSRLPFVLLTAFPDSELREHAERLGATVLDKPISMARLRDSIDRALVAGRGLTSSSIRA